MNFLKFLFVLAFIACCSINFSSAIKCYICDSVDACRNPKTELCNVNLANKTKSYLDFHHFGVNLNATSSNFECFREEIKSNAGQYKYKGCMYATIAGCTLSLRDFHTYGKYTRNCNQCSHKDKCNPADRAGTNVWIILMTFVIGVIVNQIKYF